MKSLWSNIIRHKSITKEVDASTQDQDERILPKLAVHSADLFANIGTWSVALRPPPPSPPPPPPPLAALDFMIGSLCLGACGERVAWLEWVAEEDWFHSGRKLIDGTFSMTSSIVTWIPSYRTPLPSNNFTGWDQAINMQGFKWHLWSKLQLSCSFLDQLSSLLIHP